MQQKTAEARRDLTSAGISVRDGKLAMVAASFPPMMVLAFFAEKTRTPVPQPVWIHGQPVVLTPSYGAFADPQDSPDGQYTLAVFSDGVTDLSSIIDNNGNEWPVQLIKGADLLYVSRWHPGGKIIAWIEWNHP